MDQPQTKARHAGDAVFARPAMRSPEAEHEYFSRRAADHRVLAEACTDMGQRALHLRFATAYRERATAIRSR